MGIVVVGMGPGNVDYLTEIGKRNILNADVLIGTKNHLELAVQLANKHDETKYATYEAYDIKIGITTVFEEIRKKLKEQKDVTVMVSGDPGFYSLFALIKKHFPEQDLTIIPGISSLQVGMSKIKETWEDIVTISLHGRKNNLPKLLNLICSCDKFAVLLGGEVSTHYLRDYIREKSPEYLDKRVDVMANLTLGDEEIIRTNVNNLKEYPSFSNCILFFPGSSQGDKLSQVKKESIANPLDQPQRNVKTRKSLQDHELTKKDTPMTKEEIRSILITKLQLFNEAVIWDIGAGTGSISIHAQRVMAGTGKVYAIEQSDKAYEVLKQNLEKLSVSQVNPIYGRAPQALEGLPEPDRIVIGGSGGRLKNILSYIDNFSGFDGIIVVPTVTIESLMDGLNYLRQNGTWEYQIQKIQISRAEQVGELSLWKGENPITIITAFKKKSKGDPNYDK